MTRKEKKAIYMKKYLRQVRDNGGKKLGSKFGRRATDLTMAEFIRRFVVKENG